MLHDLTYLCNTLCDQPLLLHQSVTASNKPLGDFYTLQLSSLALLHLFDQQESLLAIQLRPTRAKVLLLGDVRYWSILVFLHNTQPSCKAESDRSSSALQPKYIHITFLCSSLRIGSIYLPLDIVATVYLLEHEITITFVFVVLFQRFQLA